MDIFLDLNSLARKLTGIEKYALHISIGLIENFPEHEYFFFFRKEIHSEFLKYKGKRCHLIKSPFKSQLLSEQIIIPILCAIKRFDACIFPSFPPSPFVFKPIALICHDAAMWLFPETISLKNKLYFRPLTEIALRKAKWIFTVSESSRIGIASVFPGIANKIINISSALPGQFIPISESIALKTLTDLGITQPFFLCVGSLEPRKNIKFTLYALSALLKERNIRLVLVGRNAWGTDDIDNQIERLSLKKQVLRTGYISNNSLQALYCKAEALIFPSIYEGFGFPILEAFSCRCAVIAANSSSIPEVTRDAALLIEPTDEKSLCMAVTTIIENKPFKDKLIEKGLKRLECFSWKSCALNILQNIANK